MKHAVVTFGCRVNQADSLGFEEQFLAAGSVAASPDDADVVIVNTCSVTASADQAARQTIRRVSKLNPNARIVVTGCYATRRPEEVSSLPGVIRVVSNDEKPTALAFLGRSVRLERDESTADRFGDGEGSCGTAIEPGVAGRTAFTLRVQTGCDEICSYCIIPTTRGRPRSVPIGEVLAEIGRVVAAGFKEIALTGVHLGSYGRDLSPRASLIELLREIASAFITPLAGAPAPARSQTSRSSVDSRARVTTVPIAFAPVLFRISSLEPMDCTPDIVDLVAESPCFAPHFHLPLQHASDRMLAAMRRPYTIEYYSSLVDRIRTRIPHAAIGSDVIVGFPGERNEDFEILTRYLEASPLTHLHVFPYSDRPGTAASTLKERPHGSIVRERAQHIREVGRRLAARFRESQMGTVHRGLTLEDGSLVVTGNYLKVRIPPGRTRNEWVEVRID